jgi:hypothetical protein
MSDPIPPPALDTTEITAILLPDGQWHPVEPGTVPFLFTNPRFANPFGGPADSIPGLWLWWVEDGGQAHGTPIEQIQDTHWNPPAIVQAEAAGAAAAAPDAETTEGA